MASYTGHTGYVQLVFQAFDNGARGGPFAPTGEYRTSSLRAGIHSWVLRSQHDVMAYLPARDADLADPFTSQSFRRLRRVLPGGGTAELQVTGWWDSSDDPFRNPGIWTQLGRQVDATSATFTLRVDENSEIPKFAGEGYVIACEWQAAVRSLVGFTARIAVQELTLTTLLDA